MYFTIDIYQEMGKYNCVDKYIKGEHNYELV